MKKNIFLTVFFAMMCGFFISQAIFGFMKDKMIKEHKNGYTLVTSKEDAINVFPKTINEIEDRCAKAQKEALEILNCIITCPANEQTKETMLRAYDRAYALVVGDGFLFPVKSLYPDQTMQEAAEKESLKMSTFVTEHFECNQNLYQSFTRYLSGNAKHELFTNEEKHFLKKIMRDFRLAGMHLSVEKQKEVISLKNECSALVLAFESNIDADCTKIFVDKDALAGVPEQFIKTLSVVNNQYELCMDYPTRDIILKYCSIESTRKKYSQTFNNRAYPKNEAILKQLQEKRNALAQALGFKTYAEYNLADLMAQNPEKAWDFENELQSKVAKKVKEDFDFLMKHLPENIHLRADGKLNPWDLSYVIESIKKQYYEVDEQEFAEYFPLQKTLLNLFKIYESFFNLDIKEVPVSGLWHNDVKLLTVKKKGSQEVLGYVFMDLFPRERKYSHACHGTVLQGFILPENKIVSNVSVLVCNFTKPTKERESLMRYDEVKTFFHEFGHALHSILGATSYSALSGTSVERDFVELPSQLLENWIEDSEILKMISGHYKTEKHLSDALIEKRKKLLNFCRGIHVATQLYYGMLSLSYFGNEWNKSLADVTKNLYEKNQQFIPYDDETHFYCSFGHLGGYGAAYYGYLWSLVFADDVFAQIKKEGLLNPKAGNRYEKAILAKGGSCNAQDMLQDYLGRNPLPNAFYEKLGIN